MGRTTNDHFQSSAHFCQIRLISQQTSNENYSRILLKIILEAKIFRAYLNIKTSGLMRVERCLPCNAKMKTAVSVKSQRKTRHDTSKHERPLISLNAIIKFENVSRGMCHASQKASTSTFFSLSQIHTIFTFDNLHFCHDCCGFGGTTNICDECSEWIY